MHVRFSAVVSYLNAFDLIAAVKIIKNDSNIILGESLLTEPVTIVIPSSESQNNVAEVGQIVPVQLANSSVYYIPGRQQASATGVFSFLSTLFQSITCKRSLHRNRP